MKRAILAAVGALALAPAASAHVGYATGIGWHAPHPLTPHIGRVYYKPTPASAASGAYQAASNGPTELEQFLQHKRQQVRCGEHAAGYFSRHGVTTPRPLKGFHGCKKYSMDASYWRNRPTIYDLTMQYNLSIQRVATNIEVTAHNIILPWR